MKSCLPALRWFLLWLFLVLSGCGGQQELPEIVVGPHRISVVAPLGWVHFNHGRQQLFRQDFGMLEIRDLGPRPPPEEDGKTIDEWVDLDLRRLGMNAQRNIAKRETHERQGRSFYMVDTWDRLTHTSRKRYAFIPNNGHHLVVYTRQGDWKMTRVPYRWLLASLRFADGAADGDESLSTAGVGGYAEQ